jgi:hypothetical protein
VHRDGCGLQDAKNCTQFRYGTPLCAIILVNGMADAEFVRIYCVHNTLNACII